MLKYAQIHYSGFEPMLLNQTAFLPLLDHYSVDCGSHRDIHSSEGYVPGLRIQMACAISVLPPSPGWQYRVWGEATSHHPSPPSS